MLTTRDIIRGKKNHSIYPADFYLNYINKDRVPVFKFRTKILNDSNKYRDEFINVQKDILFDFLNNKQPKKIFLYKDTTNRYYLYINMKYDYKKFTVTLIKNNNYVNTTHIINTDSLPHLKIFKDRSDKSIYYIEVYNVFQNKVNDIKINFATNYIIYNRYPL